MPGGCKIRTHAVLQTCGLTASIIAIGSPEPARRSKMRRQAFIAGLGRGRGRHRQQSSDLISLIFRLMETPRCRRVSVRVSSTISTASRCMFSKPASSLREELAYCCFMGFQSLLIAGGKSCCPWLSGILRGRSRSKGIRPHHWLG
jgi:hypothetical protein